MDSSEKAGDKVREWVSSMAEILKLTQSIGATDPSQSTTTYAR